VKEVTMKKLLAATALAVALAEAYRRFLRAPVLTWGATGEEAIRVVPGDALLDQADIVSTRAITIDAPVSAVWPWLVQMGPGRGGVYTYDWIENLLGMDVHSVDRIIPGLQQLQAGDAFPLKPGSLELRVEILEPEHVLSLRSDDGRWVWTFELVERDGSTRLISRNRIAMGGSSLGERLGMFVMEPGSLVMERKMLLGIKQRAERLAAEPRPTEEEVRSGALAA
jgi:hypothetical protein